MVGVFHRDPAAAEELGDQRDRLLGAAGDDDLFGAGRQSARFVGARDLAPQRRQPERQITRRLAREFLQLPGEALAGRRDFARPGQRGDRELHRLAWTVAVVDDRGQVARREAPAACQRSRRSGVGAAAAPGVRAALGLQAVVGGDDRAAADAEPLRQAALRRQPGSGGDRAAQDGGLQRGGQTRQHRTGAARPIRQRGGDVGDLRVGRGPRPAFEWHGATASLASSTIPAREQLCGGMVLETDVLVVGAGAAGLMAARAASAAGASVVIVDKSIIGRGGATIMAQMTIAVALGAAEPDAPELHAADTLAGSRELGDPAIIDVICGRGPEVIREVETYGAKWARLADGSYSQVFAPGHSRKRCVYIDVLRTGEGVSQALRSTVARDASVTGSRT